MKNKIFASSDITPAAPTPVSVRICYVVGFALFVYLFFSGSLFAGVLALIFFAAIAVMGSEYRRREFERVFWYSQIRSFYIIGIPPGAYDIGIERFDRLPFVVYCDNDKVSTLCAEIREELFFADNDKDNVAVRGFIFDYGSRKGETAAEYAVYVEERVWSLIRKEEKELVRNTGNDTERLEWYVKQATGNDISGSQHIVK